MSRYKYDEMDREDSLTTPCVRTHGKGNPRILVCLALCFGLTLAVVAIYAPVINYEFVNFDDTEYVTENPRLQDGISWEAIRWSFTTGHASNWHPLTWLSHLLDCQLFGVGTADAGGHHLVNVSLHAVSSALLFLALTRMTKQLWPSALVAALFAVHPLRVESVAWISERKDVLSGVFFMLTLLIYGWYVESRTSFRYGLLIGVFALGLLAKPMLVTVPFVLLLLDIWPLNRIQFGSRNSEPGNGAEAHERAVIVTSVPRSELRAPSSSWLLIEKVPLLLLSATSCLVTIFVQRAGGAVHRMETISLAWRLVNAAVAYVMYVFKSIWPTKLAILYPHPALDPDQQFVDWLVAGIAAALLLILVTVFVWRGFRKWPFLAVGWLWYLGMLVPVIGLMQVGLQSRADRYTYLPLIGIYVMLAWGLERLIASSPKLRTVVSCIVGCSLVAYAILARGQLVVWTNSRALFEHALSVTDNNYLAHNNLGLALEELGQIESAIAHYQESVHTNPNYAPAHNNWGRALAVRGQFQDAVEHFRRATRLNPNDAKAHYNWAVALQQQGRSEEAVAHYQEALRIEPRDVAAHHSLGVALRDLGRIEQSLIHHLEAVRIKPYFRPAQISLGRVFGELGRFQEAVEHLQVAVRIEPGDARAHNNLGVALEAAGRLPEAMVHYNEAIRLNPDYCKARSNLGAALLSLGRLEEAAGHFQEVLRVEPNDDQARSNLRKALKALKRSQ